MFNTITLQNVSTKKYQVLVKVPKASYIGNPPQQMHDVIMAIESYDGSSFSVYKINLFVEIVDGDATCRIRNLSNDFVDKNIKLYNYVDGNYSYIVLEKPESYKLYTSLCFTGNPFSMVFCGTVLSTIPGGASEIELNRTKNTTVAQVLADKTLSIPFDDSKNRVFIEVKCDSFDNHIYQGFCLIQNQLKRQLIKVQSTLTSDPELDVDSGNVIITSHESGVYLVNITTE